MIYLDHGATSFPKPAPVAAAVNKALFTCANSGRGGYEPAMEAAKPSSVAGNGRRIYSAANRSKWPSRPAAPMG